MSAKSRFKILERIDPDPRYYCFGNALIWEESNTGNRVYNCIGSIDIDGRMKWFLNVQIFTTRADGELDQCVYQRQYGAWAMTSNGILKQIRLAFKGDNIPDQVLLIAFHDMVRDASKYLDEGMSLDDARKQGMYI